MGGGQRGVPGPYPRGTSKRNSGEDLRKEKLTDFKHSKGREMEKGLAPSGGLQRMEDQQEESLGKHLCNMGTGGLAKE